MSVQNVRDEYTRAAARYATSYMSNAKWRKLFSSLDRAGLYIQHSTWRFIDSDRDFVISLPVEAELDENRIQDGRFQPTEYKWIESIFVPHEYRPYANVGYTVKQDVRSLIRVLEEVGAFMPQESLDGVAILGHGGKTGDAG